MPEPVALFELNPAIDRAGAAARFAATGRVQIRDVLTAASADTLLRTLSATPFAMAVDHGGGPREFAPGELRTLTPDTHRALVSGIGQAMREKRYAFLYQRYGMVSAYREQRDPDGALHLLLEHLNDAPILELVRAISGIAAIFRADAQATLFLPGQFLGLHDDGDEGREGDGGRRVAYVLNLTPGWHPDWGGYLNFFGDTDDDIVEGLAPRFNSLNLFRVPQRHQVSFVPNWAPAQRFAITGWFRDR
jgi:Rps23 Pro-64 3,4-dihydroxylase Tpa1-like proline 4-hydroxylase